MIVTDLTMPLREGMRGVEFETKYTVAENGWNARTLHLYSHAGTHMDAPVHVEAGPQTIDQIPLADCMGRAWIADVTHASERQPLGVADLGPIADDVQPGDGLLLASSWSQYVDQPDYYRDNFPPISAELARWIVSRGVRMVGVEPPSVADVNDLPAVTEIHQILLGAGVIIVEGLTGLDALPDRSCFFAAVPLKIENGDGCPCRAFAISGVDGLPA